MATTEVEIPEEVQGVGGGVRISLAGIRFWMGKMRAISCVMPIQDVVQFATENEVIRRQDFQLRSKAPGNRYLRSDHVETIKKGLKQNANRLLLGTFVLATSPDAIATEKGWPEPDEGGLPLDVVKFGLKSGYKLDLLDAQHRSEALKRLWREAMELVTGGWLPVDEVGTLLQRSSVPVIILLERDPRQIRRMFVTMASTRPIPQSLVVAMDEFRPVNILGIRVAEQSDLLSGREPASRLEYQSSTPKGDKVYTAAVVRSAASTSLIGFRDRSPAQRDQNLEEALVEFGGTFDSQLERASKWVAEVWNYAAERTPGWREIVSGKKTPDEVREDYLVGSGAALYVIAGVLAACRAAGIDYKPVFDVVAELPWRKDQTVERDGEPQHRFFEGLLVNTVRVQNDDGSLKTEYRTAGGNRTQYQGATRKVLDNLAEDARFSSLTSPEVLQKIGLESAGRRGRPSKAA